MVEPAYAPPHWDAHEAHDAHLDDALVHAAHLALDRLVHEFLVERRGALNALFQFVELLAHCVELCVLYVVEIVHSCVVLRVN